MAPTSSSLRPNLRSGAVERHEAETTGFEASIDVERAKLSSTPYVVYAQRPTPTSELVHKTKPSYLTSPPPTPDPPKTKSPRNPITSANSRPLVPPFRAQISPPHGTIPIIPAQTSQQSQPPKSHPIMRLRTVDVTPEASQHLCDALTSSFTGLRCTTSSKSAVGQGQKTDGTDIYLLFDSPKHCTDVISMLVIWEDVFGTWVGGTGGGKGSWSRAWFEECDGAKVPENVRGVFERCGDDGVAGGGEVGVLEPEVMDQSSKLVEKEPSASSLAGAEEETKEDEEDGSSQKIDGMSSCQAEHAATVATADVETEEVVESSAKTKLMNSDTANLMDGECRVTVVRKDGGWVGDMVKMVFEWRGLEDGCDATGVPEKMLRDLVNSVFKWGKCIS
ncbi:hypothetical protein HDV00_006433 [Rhizophlyctis rosea]|nr:hypothetical protein HDV00_006433 [Rhizophlyctis rosea]